MLPVFGPAPKGGQGYAGSAYVAVRRDAASHHWAQASCAESKEDRVANALYADPSKHRVGLSPPLTVAAPAASNAADSALRPQARCVPSRGGMVLAPRVERERTHTARVPLAPAPQQVLPAAPCARPTCSGSAGQPPPRRSSELAPRAPAPRNLARTTARSCTVLCASLQWLTAHALPLVDTEASYVNIYIYIPLAQPGRRRVGGAGGQRRGHVPLGRGQRWIRSQLSAAHRQRVPDTRRQEEGAARQVPAAAGERSPRRP